MHCWMGKQPKDGKEVFWLNTLFSARQFESFDALAKEPMFHNRTLREVCDQIDVETIDGCSPQEWFA